MPYYCTVPRCTSMAGKAKNVSFHQFPRDEELAKLWNKILKRGKPYTKYSKVCSLHFTPEDYTITSVGKNKGQWRTLRKDAIPSQNLPSESPTPYQRKQWGSWNHNAQANVLDPTIHQQVAQAIYMQTMLAMQAAGATEPPRLNHDNGLPQLQPIEAQTAHTSNTPDSDILRGKHTNTHQKSTSYKCTECLKCFKDPDVFILHKRSHIKNEKNEKENFNLNLTLQANPILANLLKKNTENSNIFDGNLISMESLLMTALAANMEGYMRNFASMVKGEDRGDLNHDRGDLNHDEGDLNHNGGDLNHDEGDLNHDEGDLNHDEGDLNHDRDDLNHDRGDLNHDGNDLEFNKGSYGQGRTEQSSRGSYIQNGENTSQIDNQNCDRNLDNYKDVFNHSTDPNHDRGSGTSNNCDSSLFRDRIMQLYRNNDAYDNDRNIRYYENDRGSQDSDVTNCDDRGAMDHDSSLIDGNNVMDHGKGVLDDDRGVVNHDRGAVNHDRGAVNDAKGTVNHDRGAVNHDTGSVNHDRGTMNHDQRYNSITNNDDSQNSNEAICDSDLNESIDSHKLIIDETA